ncbi:MAG: nucleotide exchange factor GrpE [Syntrophus sp. (in: bacteria)]
MREEIEEEILDNCRNWLENLQEEPVIEEAAEQPDLYSFYEELCVLRSEFRKNSRRSHETFLQFGENLGEFQGVMKSLGQRLDSMNREQESTEALARQGILLQIVEIHERMRRFDEKLKEINTPPSPRGHLVAGNPQAARPSFWERILGREIPEVQTGIPISVIDGFSLTMSHFDEFLSQVGVRRITTAGAPFDPSVMMAVGAVVTDSCPPHTVVEEISGGYLYGDHVLKLAKVTVSKHKEQ